MQCRDLTAVQAHSVSKLGASADMTGTVVVDCLHAAVPHSSCKKYAGSSWVGMRPTKLASRTISHDRAV